MTSRLEKEVRHLILRGEPPHLHGDHWGIIDTHLNNKSTITDNLFFLRGPLCFTMQWKMHLVPIVNLLNFGNYGWEEKNSQVGGCDYSSNLCILGRSQGSAWGLIILEKFSSHCWESTPSWWHIITLFNKNI